MRPLYLIIATLFALVPADSASAQTRAFPLDSVRALLPVGTLRVDAMDFAPSPRMVELSQKLQAGARQNEAWYQQHLRTRMPGQPLPYDARLGLTREEYDEFLRLAGTLELRKVAEMPLVVREAGARLVFDGGAGLPDLTGVVIDLAADQLVTPLATVTGSREVHNDDEGAALGTYDWRLWSHEELSADGRDARVVSLAVGRLRRSGRGVIHLDMRQVQDGRQTSRVIYTLFYDVPP
jgi:hypothetical protein